MLSKKLKKHLKLRIISSIIDVLLFFFLYPISFIFLIDITSLPIYWLLPYGFIFFIFYYSVIPKLLSGYTLAGLIFRMHITRFDNSEITLWEYFKRSIYGLFAYFYFLGYIRVKTNLLGQFYFDKPFKILVVGKNYKPSKQIGNFEDFSFYFLGE